MGGDNLITKRAKVGIHDQSRGLFLNRGVFLKAPPSLFASYPSDFEPLPPQAAKQLDLRVRTITEWDPKNGLNNTPKAVVEIPPPAPTPVVTQIIGPVQQMVSEPVAASDNVQHETASPLEQPAPVGDGVEVAPKKKASHRKMKIR
jgi:hypothetical protein